MNAGAKILIAIACVLLLIAAIVLAFMFCLIFGTEFRNGEIHECVGCRGNEHEECKSCKYNPEYWEGMTYTGPSSHELKKLKKNRRR